jgi:tRNA nucleotidyltransferase/poly(A) polymerase
MQGTGQPPNNGPTSKRFTVLVTKSNQIYEVATYKRDGDPLLFQDTQGRKGGVDVSEVDWRQTTGITTEARSGNNPLIAPQTN